MGAAHSGLVWHSGSACSPFVNLVCGADSFLYVTAYPFFGFKDDKSRNRDFALFKGWSGYYDKGLYYQNGLDSTLDAFLWAAEKLGYKDIDIAG